MNISKAIVRAPGLTFAHGLTTSHEGRPNLKKALAQHANYVRHLRKLGVDVYELPPDDQYPDSTFVEDVAVIVDGQAIWTHPGAPARRGEVAVLRDEALLDLRLPFGSARAVSEPGTLDGGDVCWMGDQYLIGLSNRTNEDGALQLAKHLEALGYACSLIDLISLPTPMLHLKSGLSYLGKGVVLADPELATLSSLNGYHVVESAEDEAYAGNCVAINDHLFFPAGYEHTAKSLVDRGFALVELQMSEFRKMDGGLSCLSLRW